MLNSFGYSVSRRGTGAVTLRARGAGVLELDHIRSEIPSIFAEEKHTSRSEKFTFIPTSDVLQGLMREGFVPVEVSQGGSRIEGKAAFTKHSIRLRLAQNAPAIVGKGDALYPEIMLFNAHDGTSSYKLTPAAYRVLCANGLVSSQSLGEQKVPHKGEVVREVIEGAFRVVERLPQVIDTAKAWGGVNLSRDEQMLFAETAAALRWEPEEVDGQRVRSAPVSADQLLSVRRIDDAGSDLWRTFNRVQEAMIKGGDRYVQRDEQGRRKARRTVRPVNGVDDNRRINQALWALTEGMAALKA